jgi:hypothetical protein
VQADSTGAADIVTERARDPNAGYSHWFATLAIGRGLRFNNPYRLDRVLGSSAESLSLSATYADVAIGAALGQPSSLQHGAVLHLSVALEGITQEVLTPSYLLAYRPPASWLLGVRLGAPVIIEPDLNVGVELGALATWRPLAGLGVYGELIYSLFAGAATREVNQTLIPVLALQLGLFGSYEVLQ